MVRNHWFTNIWPEIPESIVRWTTATCGARSRIGSFSGLLLLDEPLSALDAKVRTHLRDEICQLQRKLGITTIMVTHDQDEALTMADRIVVMNHGVIEQVGAPQEIYQNQSAVLLLSLLAA